MPGDVIVANDVAQPVVGNESGGNIGGDLDLFRRECVPAAERGFVTPDLAVMFRLAGTNVNYELAGGDYGQISGVAGAAVQWWLSKPVQRRSRRRFRVLARRHRRRQHRLRTALRSRRADFQPW